MKAIVLTLALAMAMLTGCASVSLSSPGIMEGIDVKGAGGPVDRVAVINNCGLYLLWSLTVGTGDVRWNPKTQDINGGCAMFKDFSNMHNIYEALNRIAERENCELVDVVFLDGSDSSMSLFSYSGLAAGLIGVNDITVSAVLRPKKGGDK